MRQPYRTLCGASPRWLSKHNAVDRTVIIAHYDKPLRWINELKGVDVIVLTSNDGFPYRKVKNRGNDSSHYLTYIIDNYENLPDKMVFCHDHERNWTQEHSLPSPQSQAQPLHLLLLMQNVTSGAVYLLLHQGPLY